MKFSFIQIATMQLINDYEIVSEYDAKRYEVAKTMLANDAKRVAVGLNADSGLYGKVFELLMRKPSSKVTWVQAQNKTDYIARIDGKTTHIEVKTNCGRVGSFTTTKNSRTKYVVYTMCMEKIGKHERKDGTRDVKRWRIEPIIIRMDKFVEILETTEAIKPIKHNDRSDEDIAIKQWYTPFYEALKAYDATPYNRLGTYKSSEIK